MGLSDRDEPVEQPSDEALCRRVADREPGAFDLLVERYQERAYRIAWSIVRDREDAKDCAQEAFIRHVDSVVARRAAATVTVGGTPYTLAAADAR